MIEWNTPKEDTWLSGIAGAAVLVAAGVMLFFAIQLPHAEWNAIWQALQQDWRAAL